MVSASCMRCMFNLLSHASTTIDPRAYSVCGGQEYQRNEIPPEYIVCLASRAKEAQLQQRGIPVVTRSQTVERSV